VSLRIVFTCFPMSDSMVSISWSSARVFAIV
jgi:hypothetical protein